MSADTIVFSVLNLLTIWTVWDLKQEMTKQTALLREISDTATALADEKELREP